MSWLRKFLVVVIVIFLFTALDYAVHSLSPEYAVPSYYFRNKIIFGILLGLVAYVVFAKEKPWMLALLFSLSVSVPLQTRYLLEGYPLDFVWEFMLYHFLMLFVVSWPTFWLARKWRW